VDTEEVGRRLRTYPHIEQNTDEWFDVKRGIVTASVVGKLLTPTLKVAANDTSRGILATLVAERITGVTEDSPTSGDMFRGEFCEPIARDYYTEHHAPVAEMGFMRLDGDGWTLGYSPDGLVGDHGLIEIKAPRQKNHLTTILGGTLPAEHMAQCQAGLLVSGREWIDFVSFNGGMPLWTTRVEPDPAWFEAIEAACRQFEENARAMVADYDGRIVGLPMTERINMDLELVI
jgi:hypothetical protein